VFKILLLSIAAAAVGFVVISTQGHSTARLGQKLSDEILPVICGKGSSSTLTSDPLLTNVVPLVAENLITLLIIAFASMFASSSYAMHKVVTILLRSIAFTALFFSTLAFFRYEQAAEVKATCINIASNFSEFMKRDNELLAPAFHPLSYLPPLLIGVSPSHFAQQVYLHGIHPHLAEYFITLEPYLPILYSLLALILLVRPLRNIFWDNYIVSAAISGLLVMGLSFTNVRNPFDATEPVSVLALRAAIFVLATFVLLGVAVLSSRVIAQRLSLLSLLFVFMRLHYLGVPFFGLHIEIPAFIVLAVTLTSLCDTSNGAVLLLAIAGFIFNVQVLEWALLVRLLDNLGLHLVHKFQVDRAEEKIKKVKGD